MDDLKKGEKILGEGEMEGRREGREREMNGFQSGLSCVMGKLRVTRLPSGKIGKGIEHLLSPV